MAKFQINDRHRAFANAVASGMDQYKAYQQYMSPGKNVKKMTAAANSSKLMRRQEIQQLVAEASKARDEAITGEAVRNIAKEFSTPILTVGEMDAFHSAIVQGLIEVEEVVPTYHNTYDKNGRLIARQVQLIKVKRPPNIRERQVSLDALYKRGGHYAPSKFFGAIGKVNEEGELENVQRMIVLSDGKMIPMAS